ncbi:PaaI family thioesterase [Pyrobaculum arsenaticum]|uniref:Thioesterase superfamily protein n=3 Tax=Pyrobaculum TaxID=2276 RepID=A4WI51_PYRAR|nr:PaaI family thioesterase [Pyrobaculum arsenaticum]ABP50068.1 thioesterase superfamily protein [Pyrobaculum arsenaticum DSM 13514]
MINTYNPEAWEMDMGWGKWLRSVDVYAINSFIQESEPIMAFLGYRIVELTEGRACAEFDGGQNTRRVGGVLHGGAIMVALDETMGLAALTVNDWEDQVTVELKVSFLEPGVKPPFRACGWVVRRGNRLAFVEGEVRDGDGRLIAKAFGTWYFLKRLVGEGK